MSDLKCICCNRSMRNYADNGFQPDNGLAFATSGHYGSTYFDPMNGSYLEIAVCDGCVEKADRAGLVFRHDSGSRPPPPMTEVWKTMESVTIRLEMRPDGGLRVSSDDVPGLVLSHSHPALVMGDVLPALHGLGWSLLSQAKDEAE